MTDVTWYLMAPRTCRGRPHDGANVYRQLYPSAPGLMELTFFQRGASSLFATRSITGYAYTADAFMLASACELASPLYRSLQNLKALLKVGT